MPSEIYRKIRGYVCGLAGLPGARLRKLGVRPAQGALNGWSWFRRMPFCGLEAHIHHLQGFAVHSVASRHLHGGVPLLLQPSNLCRCSPMETLKFGSLYLYSSPTARSKLSNFCRSTSRSPHPQPVGTSIPKPSISLSLSLCYM